MAETAATVGECTFPFNNISLVPLFYLILTLDTERGEQNYEDNRRLLAELVLFCAKILCPKYDFKEIEENLDCSAEDFGGYLLDLAQTGAPFDGCRYGRDLFPSYVQMPDAMILINLLSLFFFLQHSFESKEKPMTSALYAQLLLYVWGTLETHKKFDILENPKFIRYVKAAMQHVNSMMMEGGQGNRMN